MFQCWTSNALSARERSRELASFIHQATRTRSSGEHLRIGNSFYVSFCYVRIGKLPAANALKIRPRCTDTFYCMRIWNARIRRNSVSISSCKESLRIPLVVDRWQEEVWTDFKFRETLRIYPIFYAKCFEIKSFVKLSIEFQSSFSIRLTSPRMIFVFLLFWW